MLKLFKVVRVLTVVMFIVHGVLLALGVVTGDMFVTIQMAVMMLLNMWVFALCTFMIRSDIWPPAAR